jgi:hypothetical protein
LKEVCIAELMALLCARSHQVKEVELDQQELEESVLVELQIENRKTMGEWT